MNLIERAKNIVLTPKTEWLVIAPEPTTVKDLYMGYVLLLAAIGPLARLIGELLYGFSTPLAGVFRPSIVWSLSHAIAHYVLTLVFIFVFSLIVDALAPTFGGEKNPMQALKAVVYSSTAVWVAGVLYLLKLGALVGLAGLYGIYVLYLGLPVLMKAPQDKAVGYTAAVVVCAFILGLIVSAILIATGGFGLH
jgi:hypothetical protein